MGLSPCGSCLSADRDKSRVAGLLSRRKDYCGRVDLPAGAGAFDRNEPWKVLKRSEEWILGPKESYERVGDVGDVVFPTGATIDDKKGLITLYYGAADYCVAAATARLEDIFKYIESCPDAQD